MKWREALNHRYAGWVVAITVVLYFSFNPRTKVIEKTVTKEVVKWQTRVVTKTKIVAGEGSTTKIEKDGSLLITGPVTFDMTRSETGTGESTTTARTTKKTIPISWRWRVGASVLVPRSFNLDGARKQIEADMNAGRFLLWDVAVGARVQFPAASWVPELYGPAITLTF